MRYYPARNKPFQRQGLNLKRRHKNIKRGYMGPNILAPINVILLLSFVVLITLAIGRISFRYLNYKKQKEEVPLLLKRDFFFLTGLATPFFGVLLFRAFQID